MSTEPNLGQSLTQHEGSLTDPSVPDRAGAIVTEVITSIAEETRSRAAELRATAEQEAREEVDSAREASGRIRGSLDNLAQKLGDLRSGIAQEEGILSNSLNQLSAGPGRQALSPPRPETEAQFTQHAVADAEVVEDEDAHEETPMAEETPQAEEKPPEHAVEQPEAPTTEFKSDEKIRGELARMSDTELGHTYVDAIRLSHDRQQAGMDPSRADAVAQAAVEEARSRPSFAEPAAPARGVRGRIASITGRHVLSPKERLREAIHGGGDS